MAEIEIEMEPLEKMNINYDVVHNDFTHDSYRAQEIASKNKKVANAVRMGAKLVSKHFYVYTLAEVHICAPIRMQLFLICCT